MGLNYFLEKGSWAVRGLNHFLKNCSWAVKGLDYFLKKCSWAVKGSFSSWMKTYIQTITIQNRLQTKQHKASTLHFLSHQNEILIIFCFRRFYLFVAKHTHTAELKMSTELFTEGKFSYHVLTPAHKVLFIMSCGGAILWKRQLNVFVIGTIHFKIWPEPIWVKVNSSWIIPQH